MTDVRLRVFGLRFAYADAAWMLDIPEFSLRRGEMTAVVGPNGSGKSTWLRLAAGLAPLPEGRVELDGSDIRSLNRRAIARVLGYLPQETPCEFDYAVAEVVAMGRYARLPAGGFLQEKDREVIKECMELTEICALAERRMSRLSGGERQRVLLASVLAQEPEVLLLDEPTGALDLHHQVRFMGILAGLAEKGLAVLVVTHDLNLASHFCRRLVLMQAGNIVKEGSPAEVLCPNILFPVYGREIVLSTHPQTGRPAVFPAAREISA